MSKNVAPVYIKESFKMKVFENKHSFISLFLTTLGLIDSSNITNGQFSHWKMYQISVWIHHFSDIIQGVPKCCLHFVLSDLWAREASIIFLNGRIIQQIKFWVEKCIKRPLSLLSKLRYSNFKIKGAFLKVTKFKLKCAKFLICWSVYSLLLTAF